MTENKAVAIVGIGAILPDAADTAAFWQNILSARYSITDVTPDRWREEAYFDPDPSVQDKTYTKIGGWVRGFQFEPLKWGIPIPPKMIQTMDQAQQWAIAASRQALVDYGYPNRILDPERVAVILGNAMAGENHYRTSLRIMLPEYYEALASTQAFQGLPVDVQKQLLQGMGDQIKSRIPGITEDTMPGELSNIIAGRVANVFNFGGPNFVTDAACASSLAALQSAVEGLISHKFDAVLSGGVDRNMGVESFVKFCKIGALSPDGSRPYSDGANGFVMGEGAAIYLLKRLEDAERDGDKIYAVVRGIGSSSDGKGKGITAPNPIGQQRALERAWKDAAVSLQSVGLIEGHGTSTKVGDVVEVNSLNAIFGQAGIAKHSVALGSVKSNIGHLKSAAGAAGVLKVALSLHHKTLPPSANFVRPNPNIDFASLPFFVNTEARQWEKPAGEVRRAGVSSFGFGGTNFHVVMEEHVPGLLTGEKKVFQAVEPKVKQPEPLPVNLPVAAVTQPKMYRSMAFFGAGSENELKQKLAAALQAAQAGRLPIDRLPEPAEVSQTERLVIDYGNADEFLRRAEKALKTFDMTSPSAWQAMTAQGVYRGSGKPGKVAFLFPGQGSQYANMLRDLAEFEPVIMDTYREADEVMTPILGRPLTSYIFSDTDEASIKEAEAQLKNTVITQPAVLTADVAIMRLLAKFGFKPDMVIGHSLGEYAALVASGVLSFANALRVVSARGREMSQIKVDDNGCMAAVSAPIEEVERTLKGNSGYVVIANINSPLQCVIAGATQAVDEAVAEFTRGGYQAVKIPVSHAFHTRIVAPASEPLRRVIDGMEVNKPQLPIAANVTGKIYPNGREEILDILAQQVASPVQFIGGIRTLYENGARVFVEVGPKRVLNALATDILKDKNDVTILATNHPRKGAIPSLSEALCGLYAAGVIGANTDAKPVAVEAKTEISASPTSQTAVEVLGQDGRLPLTGSVVITGAGLGLPGRNRSVFSDDNVERLLSGEIMIEPLPESTRQQMVDRRATRLEKSEAGAMMVEIDNLDYTIKLAGQSGSFDVVQEFGIPAERADAWDISTQLAVAAGVEALRDAGIPLVMNYRQTSKGTFLPNRWMLPEALADETGVVFGSAFPGMEQMAQEAERFYQYKHLKDQAASLRTLAAEIPAEGREVLLRQADELERQAKTLDYQFDRRFIFRVLAMGHSQFAEYIGARGPNTHVNAACATTTQAISVAEDWIRTGRCRRVIVIAGDDVTDGSLVEWIGTGMLASGASTMESDLRKAVLPFDRRRNGMIMGMGAAAVVLEAEDSARERGMRGICEVLSTQFANSAFHGTRLDVQHVSQVMERVIRQAEERYGIRRADIAAQTAFISHETYTPARGGSAAAEIYALRQVFGSAANQVIIANTKGFTGHSMGVGIEDVIAVKILERSIVPPIANYDEQFEPDPDLGDLNLSRGGTYDVKYTLRLGAGFGSQIAMTLLRQIPTVGERVNQAVYQKWLAAVAGYEKADLEVVQRTLRIRHEGPPVKRPVATRWQFGQGPTLWADKPGTAPAANAVAAPALEATSEPVPVITAAPAPVSTGSNGHGYDAIKDFVVRVVAEKTGYPADMLDLDLDLEGDLGIDTVKQAELFREIREHYGIPRREDLRLSDYNTLTKVIGFVQSGVPQTETPAAVVPAAAQAPVDTPAAAPVVQPVGSAGSAEIEAFVVGLVAEKTGYPTEMLDLDLDLEGDLGIDTVKQAELFREIRENYGIPRREDLRLADYNTLTKVIGFVQAGLTQTNTQAAPIHVESQPVAAAVAEQVQPVDSGSDADIQTFVIGLVAEKTGYPAEMLDLDLDLEGDLGIDTVKQAELFRSVRENYGIPRREDLRLADYNTLSKVIGFVRESKAGEPAAVEPAQVNEVPAPVAAQDSGSVAVIPQPAAPVDESVSAYVLGVVAEKTGYPVEMLDLDLDLEGDLGIDTVKQAELFATIRTHYGIPRREDLRLSDYNTLAKVIGFMQDASQAKVAEAVDEQAQVTPTAPEQETQPEIVIHRRVPQAILRPSLELCLPTGIEFGNGSRVIIIADEGKAADSLARRLRGRKVQVLVLKTPSAADAVEKVTAWLAEGPIQGVYFLPGLSATAGMAELDSAAWQAILENGVFTLSAILRVLPDTSFLLTATRMGGLLGVDASGSPAGGLLTGFTKALARERENFTAKAVDFETNLADSEIASRLLEETLHDPAVVEVGWRSEQRFTLTLVDEPVGERTNLDLPDGSVFFVSGGTGGITASIVTDIARRVKGVFYLTGRTALPEKNDPNLQRLNTDRNGLKMDLATQLGKNGKKATPAQVETKLAALDRAAAAWQAIDQLESAGSRAVYLSGDIANPQSVQELVDQVLKAEGRVDVLIHAAGQERSRKLENKPDEEFRQIISIKAGGLFNLVKAFQARQALPKAVVAFGSVAGRFGNSGQTDYSAANDAIAKLTTALSKEYPEMRAVTIDWGAWGEVGMASRGPIPELMRRAGIEQMPPRQAAPLVHQELVSGTSPEVVIAGALGALENEDSLNAGLDIEKANQALTAGTPIHVMLSRVTGLSIKDGVTLEAELHPDEPFLKDHALNGIPLLPGVMGIEGFAVAAQHVASVLGASKGSLRVTELEDIHFLAPFKLYRSESRRITWRAQVVHETNGLVAHVRLESTLALKARPSEVVEHFRGKVHLQPVATKAQSIVVEPPSWNGAYTVQPKDIYKLYFHGPAFQVLAGVQRSGETVLGKLNKDLPEITADDAKLVSSPILVELCLQTAGIWEVGSTGVMALPQSIGCLKIYNSRVNGQPIYAEVVPMIDEQGGMSFDARVVDGKGHLYLEMSNYRTSPLPYTVEDHLIEPLKALVKKA